MDNSYSTWRKQHVKGLVRYNLGICFTEGMVKCCFAMKQFHRALAAGVEPGKAYQDSGENSAKPAARYWRMYGQGR